MVKGKIREWIASRKRQEPLAEQSLNVDDPVKYYYYNRLDMLDLEEVKRYIDAFYAHMYKTGKLDEGNAEVLDHYIDTLVEHKMVRLLKEQATEPQRIIKMAVDREEQIQKLKNEDENLNRQLQTIEEHIQHYQSLEKKTNSEGSY